MVSVLAGSSFFSVVGVLLVSFGYSVVVAGAEAVEGEEVAVEVLVVVGEDVVVVGAGSDVVVAAGAVSCNIRKCRVS